MNSVIFRAGVLLGVSALFFSCDLLRKPPAPEAVPLIAPARNELYLSGSDRLTLDEFEALRRAYPRISNSDLVQMALDAQFLARSWHPHEGGNALREATQCVRALYPPAISLVEKKEVSALLKRSFGVDSLNVLEETLKQTRQTRSVQWNPDLIRDYGLQAKP